MALEPTRDVVPPERPSAPGGGVVELRGPRWRVGIAADARAAFPADRFAAYRDFVRLEGNVLKKEVTTRIVTFVRSQPSGELPCIMKVYSYPHLSSVVKWRALAAREFESLSACARIGVPAVEPLAYGLERNPAGAIRSCFLITRYHEDAADLREWLRTQSGWESGNDAVVGSLLGRLGAQFRHAHARNFLLGAPKLRNILLTTPESPESSELRFLDMPDARFTAPLEPTDKRRAREISHLAAPFYRAGRADLLDPFYATYATGFAPEELATLRQRVTRATLVQNNQTPLTRLRRKLHRRWVRVVRPLLGGR